MPKSTHRSDDRVFMDRCFELARRGRPSPNPFVGAVIVNTQGHLLGEGYHRQAGQAHAEVEAIQAVRKRFGAMAPHLLSTSTLYVSLEPCDHFGRQPPCTRAILEAGIPRVVFAMKDPNPKARGGAQTLRKAGVQVRDADREIEAQARALNRPFLHRLQTSRAYVTLKMAISPDGRVSTGSKTEPYLASSESLAFVHLMRDRCPAILVGIGTIQTDNPQLTCRMPGGHDPLRVIVDTRLQIDEKARVLRDANALIVCSSAARKSERDKIKRLSARGIGLLFAPPAPEGRLRMGTLLAHLARRGIDQVLLEGGPRLAASMLEAGEVDEIVLIRTPEPVGGPAPGAALARAVRTIQHQTRSGRMGTRADAQDRFEFATIRKDGKKKGKKGAADGPFWPAFFDEFATSA